MRGRLAPFTASHAASMSLASARESDATTGAFTAPAMASTLAKSPFDAMAKPASTTSTPRDSSSRAMRTFSSMFIEYPGACSPSRRVVSNILTLLSFMYYLTFPRMRRGRAPQTRHAAAHGRTA